MSRLSPARSARAEARLDGEPLFPLHTFDRYPLTLAGEVYRPTPKLLLRWASDGKRGVHLDVVWSRELLTYVTSRPALARFAAEVDAAAAAATAPPASAP